MPDEVLVYHVFISKRRLGQLLQVDRKILQVPTVLLDLAKFDALNRVSLKHAPNKVFAVGRDLHRHAVVTLFYFHKQNR